MSDKARLKTGQKHFKKMYGDVLDLPGSTPLSDFAMKGFFAEIMPQLRLSPRETRLLIIGCLAGLGADASLVEIHTRSALGNGEIAPRELDDILLLLQNYAGFPRIAILSAVFTKLRTESGKASKGKTKRKKP